MNFLKKLDKRQKLILIGLGIVTVILLWQIYSLIHETQPLAPASKVAVLPTKAPIQPLGSVPRPVQMPSPAAGAPAAVDPAASTQDDEYMRLVREYQMAQIQRMIAEDNQAIAIAKRNAAQAMAETTKLVGGGSISMSNDDNDQAAPGHYQLVYTGQQEGGAWTATLKKDGRTYDVIIGKQLPDGSDVVTIDENGVLLSQQQGAIKKLVTFSGEMQVNAKKAEIPANSTATPAVPVTNTQSVTPHATTPEKPTLVTSSAPAVVTKTTVTKKRMVSSDVTINSELASQPAAQTTKKTGQDNTEQLLNRNPNHYTIQLLTNRKLNNLLQFVKNHQLEDKAIYFHSYTKQGNDLYILIYGDYPTYAAANAALQKLPADIKSKNVLIERYAVVHTLLKPHKTNS